MIFFYSVVLTMRMCVFINESRIKPPLQWARNFLSRFDFLSTSALAKKNKTAEERLASLQGTPLGTPSRIGLREPSFRAVLLNWRSVRHDQMSGLVWMASCTFAHELVVEGEGIS